MKQLMVVCAAWLCALMLMACHDGEDVVGDGDSDTENEVLCTDGEVTCVDGQVVTCRDGAWEFESDCENGTVCHLGECVEQSVGEFEVSRLDLDTQNVVTLDFRKAGSRFLIAPYSAAIKSGTAGYSIEQEDGCSTNETLMQRALSSADTSENTVLWRGRSIRLDRHHDRRVADRRNWELRRHQPRPVLKTATKSAAACSLSSDCGPKEICQQGACTTTTVLHFDAWTLHEDLTVAVAAKGERCAMLLDVDDTQAITQEQVDWLLTSCDKVVVPRSKALFGDPIFDIDNVPTDLGDRDGDGLLHVLLSGKVNEEGVWGFFNSADFWPDENDDSNERDIIYVALPETESELPSLEATLIHEYQHLLHFVIHNWGPWELGREPDYNAIWLDEALAHLAEEIGGYGTDNPQLVADFLEAFGETALATGSDTLKRRAMGMLLMMYLFEQAGGVDYNSDGTLTDLGGAALLHAILASEDTDLVSLEAAVGKPFAEYYGDWLATLVSGASDAEVPQRYRYNPIITDSTTGNEIGILVYGSRRTVTGKTVTLNGPKLLTLTGDCFEEALNASGAQVVDVPQPVGSDGRDLVLRADDTAMNAMVIRLH